MSKAYEYEEEMKKNYEEDRALQESETEEWFSQIEEDKIRIFRQLFQDLTKHELENAERVIMRNFDILLQDFLKR